MILSEKLHAGDIQPGQPQSYYIGLIYTNDIYMAQTSAIITRSHEIITQSREIIKTSREIITRYRENIKRSCENIKISRENLIQISWYFHERW